MKSGIWGNHKTNSTPKAKKIKKRLEELGHTNVHVWWEPISRGCEMEGPDGGWFFSSDEDSIEPIGYSLEDALDTLSGDTYSAKDGAPNA